MGNWGYNPTRQFGGSFFFPPGDSAVQQAALWNLPAICLGCSRHKATRWSKLVGFHAMTVTRYPAKKTARTVVFRNGMIESVIYDFTLTSITVFLPELYIANSLPTYPNTKFLECPGELERPMWRCLQVRGVIPADIKIVDFDANFLCTKCWFPKKHICSPLLVLGEMIQFEYIICFSNGCFNHQPL